ncbi:hypothetical protein PR048_010509 [Dryococelus australis]|uniref:Uncharacterized protein n=1 Tax=Dryococelus australis TaxID=614101 RepID=A0ABQ9I2W6_9NEOP|nr:hypothetical protein PR048_010509 [Dryococelus australis]
MRTGLDPWRSRSWIFACGNHAERSHLSAGFHGDLSFPPPFHSGATPYSPHFTLIGSQDLAVKSCPHITTPIQTQVIFRSISLQFEVIFVIGKSFYTIKKPQGNVIVEVSKCIGHAVAAKIKSKGEKRDHWLNYADDKYPEKLIEDIKATLRILLLFVPLPFFWALFDQQGSRWTIQATQMNGALGSWAIKPDQMQVLNPLLVLALIPLYETVIYPTFAKCNLLNRPLQRMVVGGLLAAIAFGISAVVELQLEVRYLCLGAALLPSSCTLA